MNSKSHEKLRINWTVAYCQQETTKGFFSDCDGDLLWNCKLCFGVFLFFFFYAMGIGTPEGHFWLEAVNEMTMQEKSVVSEMQRATISWPTCSQGTWTTFALLQTRHLCHAGTVGLALCKICTYLPWLLKLYASRQDLSFPHLLSDSSDRAQVLGIGFCFEKRQIKLSFSTPLPQDFLYYHIFLKAFGIGLHIWAHCWMSGYNVCLAWSKFRVNRQLCFLNMRHRISLYYEDRQITPQIFFCMYWFY